MFYLIVFLILFVLTVLNVQMHDKLSSQLLSGIAALMLIAVAGLRFETGGDWNVYAQLFAEFPSWSRLIGNPSLFMQQPVEEGFVLLCAAIKALGGTVQHLFFIVAFINITLIACALPKYTKYPVVGLLCYFGLLYFNLEMIYIRQATAVALCFFSLQYLQQRKLLPYLIIILIVDASSLFRIACENTYMDIHRRHWHRRNTDGYRSTLDQDDLSDGRRMAWRQLRRESSILY